MIEFLTQILDGAASPAGLILATLVATALTLLILRAARARRGAETRETPAAQIRALPRRSSTRPERSEAMRRAA